MADSIEQHPYNRMRTSYSERALGDIRLTAITPVRTKLTKCDNV